VNKTFTIPYILSIITFNPKLNITHDLSLSSLSNDHYSCFTDDYNTVEQEGPVRPIGAGAGVPHFSGYKIPNTTGGPPVLKTEGTTLQRFCKNTVVGI
jgi:hypothetical protein